MNTQTEKSKAKDNKRNALFRDMTSVDGMDDWTLYKTKDFEVLNEKQGGFLGYLVGYKFTKKKSIPMFYFVTDEGEMLKTFGNGNLTSQLSEVLEKTGINTLVGIYYEGLVEVDFGGDLGKTDVNQWKVFHDKKKASKELANLALEIDGLITEPSHIVEYVNAKREERKTA